MWQEAKPAPAGQATPLGDTGVAVTLTSSTGSFHPGDFWRFALRPIQPTIVYPTRYLTAPQPPDGPRTWACPLAVLAWEDGTATATSCVPLFSGLTGQTAGGGGCCTVAVGPSDVNDGASLQALLNRYATQGPVTVCLEPGTYTLPAPLALGSELDGLTLQACQGGVILQATSQPSAEPVLALIAMQDVSSVTIRGIELSVPLAGFSPPAGSFSSLPQSNQVMLDAFSAGLQVGTGIWVDDSTGLTIEDCTFDLPDPGQANVFAAGIFATGTMEGTQITGCTFQCASPPATVPFNGLTVTQVANNQPGAPPPYQLTFGYLQVAASWSAATATFNSPGNYSFTVPAGVNSITVTAIGAAGGSSAPGLGGQGASVMATFAVQPGEQLSVTVGEPGSVNVETGTPGGSVLPWGIGGGAPGGATGGAGGGGLSAIEVPTTPLIIAGGGGGAGGSARSGYGGGGNAGSPGYPGSPSVIGGGGAGTSSAGGQPGASQAGAGAVGTASPAYFGAGGAGAPGVVGGGGGAGGHWGGGGGGAGQADSIGGGGGGGSSFVAAGAANVIGPTPTSEAAQVTITYAVQRETTQLLRDATIERNLFEGVTVPVLAITQLGTLRVDRNTIRSAYGGFWLVSLASLALQSVLFELSPVGDPNLYSEFSGSGIAALRDVIFMIATAIGQVLPAALPEGGALVPGSIPAPTAAPLALARQALTSFSGQATGPGSPPAGLPPRTDAILTSLGAPAPAAATIPATDTGTSVTLRLDLSGCQVDAVIAGSYSGAGLLVADFTADAGSALLHGNRIRSRFPMGEAALVGGVGEVCVTGNVVANEVAPQVTFQAASPAAQLPSYSMVLNPATARLGAALDPSGMLFGDVPGVAAVAVTGNVFVDPSSLPPRPATLPPALADWDVLNTVIGYSLPVAVTGILPASGPATRTVTVTGSGFTGANAVNFGPNPGSQVSVSSDTALSVAVPYGTGTVDVTVTTPAGTSLPVWTDQFSYLEVTSVFPAAFSTENQLLTVYGGGFVAGSTEVTFSLVGGAAEPIGPVSAVVMNSSTLQVPFPGGNYGEYSVMVTTPYGFGGGAGSGVAFQYTQAAE